MKKNTHLISFATESHKGRQLNLIASAEKYGIENFYSYREWDISKEFREKNKEHFQYKRLYAYSVWRAHLILKAMETIPVGDIVFYCDADVELIKDPLPLIELTNKTNFLCFILNGCLEKRWTKGDIFEAFSFTDIEYILNSDQITSSYFMFINNDDNRNQIENWNTCLQNFHLVSDEPSKYLNFAEFEENRHDQSLFSFSLKDSIMDGSLEVSAILDLGDYGIIDNEKQLEEYGKDNLARSDIVKNTPFREKYFSFTNHKGLN